MSTWIEIAAESGREPGSSARMNQIAGPTRADIWRGFDDRRGTGSHSFIERLSRARLLYLRRHEAVANWLALVLAMIFIGCSSVPRVAVESPAAHEIATVPLPAGDSFSCTENRVDALESTQGAQVR